MKLIIADDHPIVLDGLEALLEEARFTVLARCGDGEEVIAALQTHDPDVLILDIHMPGLSGLDVLRRLRAERHSAKVVVMTSSLDDHDLVEAVRLKVDGVLLKRTASHRLIECLQAVNKGEVWIDPEAMQRLIQARSRFESAAQKASPLTPRDLDVTRLVASGLRNKEIAHELAVSEATVKMRLHNIYEKLGLGSRTELALFARDNELL